ncbi:MAG: hypothetical protein PHX38_09695 [Sulfuricella sp.]|nr:hypothetical protein [Sulfuricella sp.]
MFAIKDLENLKNLAAILVIPFLAAAYICDGALEIVRDPILDWLRNNDAAALTLLGWAAWFLIVIGLITLFVALIDFAIVWLHVNVGDAYVMAWFGFACITAGLFILSPALPNLPNSPLNPFWHLGLLCYGFSLVDRSAK